MSTEWARKSSDLSTRTPRTTVTPSATPITSASGASRRSVRRGGCAGTTSNRRAAVASPLTCGRGGFVCARATVDQVQLAGAVAGRRLVVGHHDDGGAVLI